MRKKAEKVGEKGEKKHEKKQRYGLLRKVARRFEKEMRKKEPSKKALALVFNDLYTLATKDQLTGVFNRRSLEEALGREVIRAIRHNLPLSAIMLDIDNFKEYNDKYGHFQGDNALKTVTRVVELNTRGDDFVARYGGEEFIVILPNTKITQAAKLAERIRTKVASAIISATREDLPKGFEKVTVSIGVAQLSEGGVKEMLDGADQALYEAKRQGKNKVVISKKKG